MNFGVALQGCTSVLACRVNSAPMLCARFMCVEGGAYQLFSGPYELAAQAPSPHRTSLNNPLHSSTALAQRSQLLRSNRLAVSLSLQCKMCSAKVFMVGASDKK
jgi:hypothetical protein